MLPGTVIDVRWHDDVLLHDTGSGLFDYPDPGTLDRPELHPEGNPRIQNMKSQLERGVLRDSVRFQPGRHATVAELERVHDGDYIASIEEACREGTELSRTTLLSRTSWPAVLASAGTALEAGRSVLAGETAIAYALVRPPGHHAARAMADGYCFFNQVALCAEQARDAGAERVAIVDWDVHHGNGTQSIFYERSDVLTISLHMRHGSWGPTHPETGAVDEHGAGAGLGANLNIELALGTGDGGYLEAFDRVVAPALERFAPDVVIGACGQDACQFDPNGRQAVSCAGFHGIGTRMASFAERYGGGRLLLVQEGGYAPTYSAVCLEATLLGVLGMEPQPDPIAFLPDQPERARADIDAAAAAVSQVPAG
jgi:acetoin utilization deacetylase AcuC-like enzyme